MSLLGAVSSGHMESLVIIKNKCKNMDLTALIAVFTTNSSAQLIYGGNKLLYCKNMA